MVIAAKEVTEVNELLGKDQLIEGVIEVFSFLVKMPSDPRIRMAQAIYETEQAVKSKEILSESEEAK